MNVVSVRHDPEVRYPDGGPGSPPSPLPAEYPFPNAPAGSSGVYGLVRDCLRDTGADAAHFGTPAWNPLGEWIEPGMRVFLLPNLVVDRRERESALDFAGKCTHASVLRPMLDYATIATGDAGRVAFGNAALQSCRYDRVAEQTGMAEVGDFYRTHAGTCAGPVDLRAVVSTWTRYGALLEAHEQNPEDVVLIDLGERSLLDPFFRDGSQVDVRVSDYDHRYIEHYHGPGRHIYAIHRRVLETDVLISVPKLKTHEKVGLTCAVKGTVGSVARKECLAHHRKGGAARGGDEFPAHTPIHTLASELADRVTTLGSGVAPNVLRVASKGLYKALRLGRGIMAGAWFGNDTAWRMAVDIARILRYCRVDGSFANTPQRRHLVIVDGIVGGEREGPVYPSGIRSGLVLFGSDPVWSDVACALLMGFDPAALPIVHQALEPMELPLADPGDEPTITVNGTRTSLDRLPDVLERPFTPAKGWVGHLELRPTRTAD